MQQVVTNTSQSTPLPHFHHLLSTTSLSHKFSTLMNLLKEDEEFEGWLAVSERYGYPSPVDAKKLQI